MSLVVTTPSDREIVLTRGFDAPAVLVHAGDTRLDAVLRGITETDEKETS